MDNARNNRKIMAGQTLQIISNGEYTVEGVVVHIGDDIARSRDSSELIAQGLADSLEQSFSPSHVKMVIELTDESTLSALLQLQDQFRGGIGVLNFASAKNPGGGFLNGALAQEESLAIASNLYDSQIKHEEYYTTNRTFKSMVYTDTAIWSPDVVFFRNEAGDLLAKPAKASVLTLPAVNMGQVIQKGENIRMADEAMRRRMKIALAIFAKKNAKCIVLGAYGCGVFRNNPYKVALWWKELLAEYSGHFEKAVFAVLDRSKQRGVFKAFENNFQV
ncbi:MAG: TIGR02452 family protein [Eubacteriaceae bacterium]|nr:TIGR02452 family protein [Eubacteriaceae bacterium]